MQWCDQDGGYHIPYLHHGLNSELDMSTYKTTCYSTTSVQQCKSTSARVGSSAVYVYMFPNVAINKFGCVVVEGKGRGARDEGLLLSAACRKWMDVNLVLPISTNRCVVVFDWFHVDADTRRGQGVCPVLFAVRRVSS